MWLAVLSNDIIKMCTQVYVAKCTGPYEWNWPKLSHILTFSQAMLLG